MLSASTSRVDSEALLSALAEVAAIAAAYPEFEVKVHDQAHQHALEHFKAGQEEAAMEAVFECDADTDLVVMVTLHSLLTLEVSLIIPTSYPTSTQPIICTVMSMLGAHDTQLPVRPAALQLEMQQAAEEAAAQGETCLFYIMGLLATASQECERTNDVTLHHSGYKSLEALATRSPADSWRDPAKVEQEEDVQVLLVRLNHMHDKGMYTRTLRAWMSELDITGRLVFLSSCSKQGGGTSSRGASGLILLILQGNRSALKRYLIKHRTETVDVDSRGRKCTERMMDVLLQQPCQHGSTFTDYREVVVGSLAEVEMLIEQDAGMTKGKDVLRTALGLTRIATQ